MEKMNIPDQQDISSKPTTSSTALEIRVDPIEKMNIIDGTDIRDEMNIPDPQDTSSNPTAITTTLEVQVDPVEKITGAVEQTRGSERCGSSSTHPLLFQVSLWLETLEV